VSRDSQSHRLFVWSVLICSERKVLLADCWWLICYERKVLMVVDKANEPCAKRDKKPESIQGANSVSLVSKFQLGSQ
jgi:hypothetical protein